MRRMAIAVLMTSAFAISACGNASGTFANRPRPPTPVNLTVYVNNARISVSPSSVGGGPVVFIITNQASQAESLAITAAGQAQPLAQTAPINPQATTQLAVDFRPGAYLIAIGQQGTSQAAQSATSSIRPASLVVGPERPSSSGQLLRP